MKTFKLPTEGGTTSTVAVSATPLAAVAMTRTPVPSATPVTRPVELTVANALLLLVQVNVVGETAPPASRPVAVSCRVPATATLVGLGVTSTVATGPAGPPHTPPPAVNGPVPGVPRLAPFA